MGVAAILPAISIASAALGAVSSFQGQRAAGKAASAQAGFQAQVARNNQIIASRKATDAIARGEEAEAAQRLRTRQAIGRARVGLAAGGQVVGQGSALDLVGDIREIGEIDALTIRSNAAREAAGFEAQGTGFQNEAALADLSGANLRSAAKTNSFTTLLTGSGAVASKWFTFKQAGAFSG